MWLFTTVLPFCVPVHDVFVFALAFSEFVRFYFRAVNDRPYGMIVKTYLLIC